MIYVPSNTKFYNRVNLLLIKNDNYKNVHKCTKQDSLFNINLQ